MTVVQQMPLKILIPTRSLKLFFSLLAVVAGGETSLDECSPVTILLVCPVAAAPPLCNRRVEEEEEEDGPVL